MNLNIIYYFTLKSNKAISKNQSNTYFLGPFREKNRPVLFVYTWFFLQIVDVRFLWIISPK